MIFTKKAAKLTPIILATPLFFLGFFGSCNLDLGLGTKVDSEKPEIFIETPESIDYVRGSFTLKGTCSDDTYVKSVSAVIKDMKAKTKYGPFEGKVSEDSTTWFIEIENSVDEKTELRKFPDGEYQVIVTATDSENRKSETERSFFIDNTPPLIVLETPSTGLASYSQESYGQKLKIAGQTSDFSGTSLLEFYFFKDKELTEPAVLDEKGKEVPVVIENPSEKLSEVIASFENEGGIYEKLYGKEKAGGKIFYGKVLAYDNARKNPAVDGDKGNCTEGFYFVNDVYSKGFSFSLNPQNNPVYSLSQYKALSENENGLVEWSEEKIPNGTSIGINIQSGLDKYLIEEDSLQVIARRCDESGKIFEEESPVVLLPAVIDAEKNKLITDEEILKARGARIKANGSYNRNLTVDICKTENGLQVGKNYLLQVQGWDSKGNDFCTENGEVFGFQMVSNGKLPELKITNPPASNSLIFASKEGLEILGTAEHDEAVPKVHVFVGEKEITSPEGEEVNNIKYQIPVSLLTEGSNVITVQAWNEESFAEEKRTVIYDTEAPLISGLQISPVVNETDNKGNVIKKFVNGKISVTGLLQDLYGIEKSAYRVLAKFDGKEVLVAEGENLSNPSFALKNIETDIEELKSVKSEIQMVVEVTARDAGGNEAKEILEGFIIDQSTDLPKINISENQIKPLKKGEWISADQKLPSLNLMEFISGNITDDDGISSAKIKLYDADPETFDYDADDVSENFSTRILNPKNNIRLDFSEQMPNVSGFYYLVIEAEDINQKKSVYESFVKISGRMATISVTDGNKEFVTQLEGGKNKIELSGVVSGESSNDDPLCIYVLESKNKNIEKKDSWKKIWEAGKSDSDLPYVSGSSVEWNAVLDFSSDFKDVTDDGIHTLIIRAFDENQKWTDTSFTYYIDNTKPVISEISSPIEDGLYIQSDKYQFRGKISESGSGLKEVYYQFVTHTDKSESSVSPDESKWVKVENASINFFQSFVAGHNSAEDGSVCEGSHSLFIKAVDETGLESEIAERKFFVDLEKPAVDFDSEILSSNKRNTVFSLSGTVTDSCLVPSKIYISENGGVAEEFSVTSSDGLSGTWTTGTKKYPSASDAPGGTYKYKVTVTDASGKSSSKEMEIIYDVTAPDVQILSPLDGEKKGTDAVSENKYTFRGEASDPDNGTGVSRIYWAVTTSDTAPAKKAAGTAGASATNNVTSGGGEGTPASGDAASAGDGTSATGDLWSSAIKGTPALWTFDKSFDAGDEGTYYVHVYAEDAAGNTSEIRTRSFDVDFSVPSLAAAFPAGNILSEKFVLSGTASDTSGLKDGGKVYVYQKFNSGEETLAETVSVKADGTWSCAAGLPSGTAEDGKYSFRVATEDVFGKKTEKVSKTYIYDTKAPSACSWTANGETKTFRINSCEYEADGGWYTTNVIQVEGYYKDEGTGVSSVTVEVKKNGTVVSSKEISSGLVTVDSEKGICVYTAVLDNIPSGDLTVSVSAKDGNNHTSSITNRTISVDLEKPEVYFDDVLTASKIRNEKIVLSGTASDDARLPAKIYISENGGVEEEFSVTSSDGLSGTWTTGTKKYPSASDAPGGTYKYKVTVTDASGKSSSKEMEIIYDVTAPDVQILSPLDGEKKGTDAVSENKYTFRGEASDPDNGTGVSKIYWAVTASGSAPAKKISGTTGALASGDAASGGDGTPATGDLWSSSVNGTPALWTFDRSFDAGDEGTYYVHVYAEDAAGNTSEIRTRSFDVDFSAPSLAAAFPSGNILSEKFALSGTASDTSGLKDGGKVFVYQKFNSGEEILAETVSVKDDGTWTTATALPSGTAEDGKYSFRVVTEDVFGKKTEKVSKTYIYDTKAPSACSWTANGETKTFRINSREYEADGSWYTTNVIQVEGYYKDEGTGVSSVTVEVKKNGTVVSSKEISSGLVTVDTEKGICVYTAVLDNIPSGDLTVSVSAKDGNNHTSSITNRTISVDLEKPEAAFDSELTSVKIRNAKFVLWGTASDDARLPAKIFISENGGVAEEFSVTSSDGLSGIWTTGTKKYPSASDAPGGTYKYKVTVTDASGKSSSKEMEIIYDVTAPDVQILSPLDGEKKGTDAVSENKYTFRGEASDPDNGTGVSRIYWAVTTSETAPAKKAAGTAGTPATGDAASAGDGTPASGDLWSSSVNGTPALWTFDRSFDAGDEGTYYVHVYAEDAAGNTSEIRTRSFDVDFSVPELEAAFPAGNILSEKFVLSGTASDTSGLKDGGKVYVYQKFNSGEETLAETVSVNDDGTWSCAAGLPAGTAEDGKYSFRVVTEDVFGKKTEKVSKTYIYDTKAPSACSWTANGETKTFRINSREYEADGSWYTTNVIQVEGYYKDEGTGVSSVTVEVKKNGTVVSSKEISSGLVTVDTEKGICVYTAVLDNIPSGDLTVSVSAKDGNNHTSSITNRTISVDLEKPEAAFDSELTSVKIRNAKFVLSGTASDDARLPSKIYISENGGVAEEFSVTSSDGLSGTWTTGTKKYPSASDAPGGTYKYKVTVTDASGKSSSKEMEIIYDVTAPDVQILSPLEGEKKGTDAVSENKYTFRGEASDPDNGTGVSRIYWAVTASETAPAKKTAGTAGTPGTNNVTSAGPGTPASDDAASAGDGTPASGDLWSSAIKGTPALWTFDKSFDAGDEGTYYVHVYAEDAAGNTSEIRTRSFDVDFSVPELAAAFLAGNILSEKFVLSGTASDTSGLKDGGKVYVYQKFNSGEETLAETCDGNEEGTWTTTTALPSGTAEDGKYSFRVVTEDVFGKKTEKVSKTYIYDTKAPSACSWTANGETKTFRINSREYEADGSWYTTNVIQVEGYYKDEGTGLSGVRCEILKNGSVYTSKEITEGFVLVDAEKNIYMYSTGFTNLPSGNLKLRVQAVDLLTDIESHYSSKTEYQLNLDVTNPEIECETKQIVSNGSADITISGTLKDADSGIDYIQAYVGSVGNLVSSKEPNVNKTRGNIKWYLDTTSGENIFELTIDADNTNNWFSAEKLGANPGVYATVYDNAGNFYSRMIASISIDKEAPSVKIIQPSENFVTNKEFVFSGTAGDKGGLKNIVLQYASTDASSPWKNLPDGIITEDTWSINIETDQLSDIEDTDKTTETVEMKIRALATDKAGNTSVSSAGSYRVVTLDPKTDRPVITMGNMTNVGDQGCTLKYRNITGTVQDDDGLIKNLWFTLNKELAGKSESFPEAVSTYSDDELAADCLTDWVPVIVSETSWSLTKEIEHLDDDTEHEIYFYCIDLKDGKFSTAISDDETKVDGRVVLKYRNDSTVYDNGKGAKFIFSTDVPEFGMITIAGNSSQEIPADSWKNASECYFGGTKKYLYAKVEVFTRSPIDADSPLTLKVNSKEISLSEENGNLSFVESHYVDADGNTVEEKKGNRTQWTYIAGPFDMTKKENGAYVYAENTQTEFTWTAKSGSGKTLSKSIYVNTDHSGPEAKITSPKEDNPVYGEITVSGIVTDEKAGTAKIQYVIPKVINGNQELISEITEWKSVTGSATFDIVFNEESSEKEMAWYVNEYYPSDDRGVSKVPVYFRLTDKLGNVTLQDNLFISYDENSEIPSCTINYPGSEVTAVSGDIDVSVLAKGGSGVDEVHLQFLPVEEEVFDVASDGTKTKTGTIEKKFENISGAETAELLAYFDTVRSWGMYIYGEKLFALDASGNVIPESSLGVIPVKHWYILADSNTYWTKTVSTGRMTVSSGNTLTRVSKLGIRAEAYYAGKTKGWAQTEVAVNFDQPSIKNLKLVQRNNADKNAEGCQVLSSFDYKDNMYIPLPKEGFNWYLDGFCQESSDEDKQRLSVFEALTLTSAAGKITSVYKELPAETSEYEFSLPLLLENKDGKVKISLTITNVSGKGGDNPTFVEFNVDKTSPVIGSLDEAAGNGVISNKNMFYELKGSFEENGSGLDSILYYFKRTTKSGGTETDPRIYDPGINYLDSESRINLGETSDTNGRICLNEDNLPVLIIHGAERPSQNQIKASLLKNNPHVRIGSLIKTGGLYFSVTEINGAEGIITFDGNIEKTVTKLQVVYANAVGSRSIETSSGTWTDSIRSDNIPDGPVELHVVAIDQVGNTSHKMISSAVRNNGPRLAKLLLGTDLNGSGDFDFDSNATVTDNTISGKEFGEFVYYSCLDQDDKPSKEIALHSDDNSQFVFTIKDKLAVIPEFVGGNGEIKYTIQMAAPENGDSLSVLHRTASGSLFEMKKDSVPQVGGMSAEKGYILLENESKDSDGLESLNSLSINHGKENPCWFGWTFWDATEETVQGDTSQFAFLKFKAIVNTVDKTPPESNIERFYWNSLKDNSIYGSASAKRTIDLKGHIELEDDLTEEIKSSTVGETALGSDPKVSGKIVIKGSTWDDVKLSSLWLRFGDVNFGTEELESESKTYFKVAEFKKVTDKWEWGCQSTSMNSDGWEFKIKKNEFTQAKHYVEWELAIDTSLISGESGLDVSAEILSVDTGIGNDAHDGNYSIPAVYQMDVVPYVTELVTNLSTKDEENPSIYTRSARGRYQVRGNKNAKAAGSDSADGEDVIIKGFNLGNEPLHIINVSDTSGGLLEIDTAADNPHTFNVGDMKSGLLKIAANGIEVLNNKNSNGARGSAEFADSENSVCYNMQPNYENNNSLTDDLKIDVWEFKNGATKVNSELANPTVRFNPKNGSIGMSFVNGIDFDMPGGTYATQQYSHIYSMRGTTGFGDSTFAFDKNGYSYGAAQDHYDSGSMGNAGHFRLSLSRYLNSNYSTDNANYGHTGSVRLEANSINTKMYPNANYTEWQTYMNRVVSPQIVAVAEDSDSKKVMLHVAYADTATNQIRYRRSYVNANSVFGGSYTNNTAITYNQEHVVPFSPRGKMETSVPDYYRITALPDGCTDESLIGKEVTLSELPSGAEKNVHYVDISTNRFLAGSSLRNISDVDSTFQFGNYDLSELLNEDGSFSDYRFPSKMWAVDFANNRIDQNTTANRNSYGNKPMYPYSKFSHGLADYNSAQEPDSLQNQAGQTIHVLASSGIDGSVMDVYKKNPESLIGTDDLGNSKTYYKKQKNSKYLYNAGRSVALGVADNGAPVIAWHDNEKNRLNISFNTEAELEKAEDDVAALSTRNGGTGGTLYGKEGTYSGTPAYYVCYSYNTNSSLTPYIRYYRLYNNGTSGKVEDLDENQFVDKAIYDGNTWAVANVNAYIKVPTGMYATPTKTVRYKVMKMHSTKVQKKKYLTQTITEVFNSSGKLISTDIAEVERAADTVTTTFPDKDEYVYTTGNVLTRGGAVLEEWMLNGKLIYTPVNRTVEMYADIPPVDSDVSKTTKVLSDTTDAETGNRTKVTRKDVNRDYYDIQSTIEFLQPDSEKKYHAADSAGVYVSYPVYKLYTNKNEYMGCATENTQLSFDRTEVWEDHTKQVGKGGAYVQMQVVDSTVHLAYYEEDSGSLKYTRIPFTGTGFGEAETWTVDGYNDIGENLTLDVIKDENGNHIPYIGYYGNKRAKLAYLAEPGAENLAGAVNDRFTGVWEILYVPSERSVGSDRINVAMRKDTDGKVLAGKDAADGKITANTSATYVYSNATTNPVMGYINALGNLELGQKR